MANPITTASNPRVGEDWVLVPRVLDERMRKTLHSSVAIRCYLDKREASILNDQAWWGAVLASAPTPPDRVGEEVGRELGRLAKPLVDGFKACEELCSLADGDIPDNAEIYVRGAKRSSFGLFTYGDLRTLAAKIASAPSPEAEAGGDLVSIHSALASGDQQKS